MRSQKAPASRGLFYFGKMRRLHTNKPGKIEKHFAKALFHREVLKYLAEEEETRPEVGFWKKRFSERFQPPAL